VSYEPCKARILAAESDVAQLPFAEIVAEAAVVEERH
jgi:hypothetical protein